jgi:hypothetical protein
MSKIWAVFCSRSRVFPVIFPGMGKTLIKEFNTLRFPFPIIPKLDREPQLIELKRKNKLFPIPGFP